MNRKSSVWFIIKRRLSLRSYPIQFKKKPKSSSLKVLSPSPPESRLENVISAVWETSVSRHNRDPIKSFPKTPPYDTVLWWSVGAINWSSMMPRDDTIDAETIDIVVVFKPPWNAAPGCLGKEGLISLAPPWERSVLHNSNLCEYLIDHLCILHLGSFLVNDIPC